MSGQPQVLKAGASERACVRASTALHPALLPCGAYVVVVGFISPEPEHGQSANRLVTELMLCCYSGAAVSGYLPVSNLHVKAMTFASSM